MKQLPTWQEMFPNGRTVFYEGDDSRGFMREMRTKYGFTINKNLKSWRRSKMFHLPGHLMDKVYGNSKYPLGS